MFPCSFLVYSSCPLFLLAFFKGLTFFIGLKNINIKIAIYQPIHWLQKEFMLVSIGQNVHIIASLYIYASLTWQTAFSISVTLSNLFDIFPNEFAFKVIF